MHRWIVETYGVWLFHISISLVRPKHTKVSPTDVCICRHSVLTPPGRTKSIRRIPPGVDRLSLSRFPSTSAEPDQSSASQVQTAEDSSDTDTMCGRGPADFRCGIRMSLLVS